MSSASQPVIGRALVVGASRGLGLALTKELARRGTDVFATVRSTPKPGTFPDGVKVIEVRRALPRP